MTTLSGEEPFWDVMRITCGFSPEFGDVMRITCGVQGLAA